MRGSIWMGRSMGRGSEYLMMVPCMRGSSMIITYTGKEYIDGLMGRPTQESGSSIRCMGRVS
jgi:hypothetical protein